jgi:hypothetical protein
MTERRNTLRSFALICVATSSAYVMVMGWRIIEILAAPQWCARALGAGNIIGKDKTVQGLEGCIDLLKIQLGALRVSALILLGTLALCLLVLMVIVIAGGKMSFRFDKTGGGADFGRDQAVDEVAGAAVEKAEEIKEEAKP